MWQLIVCKRSEPDQKSSCFDIARRVLRHASLLHAACGSVIRREACSMSCVASKRRFLELKRCFLELRRSFLELKRCFFELKRCFLELKRCFLELKRCFLEFATWYLADTPVIEAATALRAKPHVPEGTQWPLPCARQLAAEPHPGGLRHVSRSGATPCDDYAICTRRVGITPEEGATRNFWHGGSVAPQAQQLEAPFSACRARWQSN